LADFLDKNLLAELVGFLVDLMQLKEVGNIRLDLDFHSTLDLDYCSILDLLVLEDMLD